MNERGEDLGEWLRGAPRRVHLLGVAGSGMSGIAALLLGLGHRVSGSDRSETSEVKRLQRKGLIFTIPHSAECVRGAEMVVFSSAIKPGNVAFDEARRLGIPMVRRAEALAAIMGGKRGIVVCGMHGKTTTTSLAAHVLRHCGLRPSHYVGAEIPILGSNARWDSDGEYFVAEGDESDGSLVLYRPEHAIVLNIEPEHLDFYGGLEDIEAVFSRLVAQTSGKVIYCGDDPVVRKVCEGHSGAISYGLGEGHDWSLGDFRSEDFRSSFEVVCRGRSICRIRLNIPGQHNACNALAVVALAAELGLSLESVCEAVEGFQGAKRRFQILWESSTNVVVDDYGHHPTEIAATLATARSGRWRRVLVMFQPHRYTRTQALREEFGKAFDGADKVVVGEIYAAGEKPIEGVTGLTIVEELKKRGHPDARFQPVFGAMHWEIGNCLEDGDLVLSLGAGNIHEAGERLVEDLVMRERLMKVMGSGRIVLYEPLAKHTTMRVGGPAQFWVEPETEDGFVELVRFCSDAGLPLMVVGRGSNLLVRDGGISGVVVHLSRGEFTRVTAEGCEITAGAGVRLKQLSAVAKRHCIGGFEWMEGIPGTLGGSLRMNAGAMGVQTFEQVVKVRFCDEDGNVFTKTPSELEVGYRDVPFLKRNYALSATLRGEYSPIEEIERGLRASAEKRQRTQPVAASAGCIFKNPPGIPAGKLIDELGLKGLSVGGVRVSPVHANFIVNEGGATAADVIALISRIQEFAMRERGIRLETEVQIVGKDVNE